jgi:hypothetical protein
MKALNSSISDARRVAYTTGAGMLFAFLLLSPVFASATSYTLTVSADKSIYNSGNTITISGSVSPAPPTGSYVGLKITNAGGTLVDVGQASVGPTGSYSTTFTASYAAGTYTVTGSWAPNASATAITGTANFQMNGTTTSTSAGSGGTTTTVQITTTVVQQGATTTVVQQGGTTTVSSILSSVTTDSTALAVGALGLIVAIVAIVLAVLFMRKK